MARRFLGILASISWNSNRWAGPATKEDVLLSNFKWVRETQRMVEDLNFAHLHYPAEPDGTFIGYTPMFDRQPSANESKYVEIVFFKSLDYHKNQNYIVGFYAFPDIGKFLRKAEHDIYKRYEEGGNVKSKIENILIFKNPIPISDTIATQNLFLPPGKKLGQQGFNYLFSENVIKILDKATYLNPEDKKLSSLKLKILKETGSVL